MFKVIRDANGFGVVDDTQTLINELPMSRAEAQALAAECNTPKIVEHWIDELPDSDYWDGGCPD